MMPTSNPIQLDDSHVIIRMLEEELAATNQDVLLLTLELEERVAQLQQLNGQLESKVAALHQSEALLQREVHEKGILLQEIHHRVKNNLQIVRSLLDLQSSQISDPVLIEILKDSQNRVTSMALVHQTLYQSNDLAHVDFKSFLDSLVPTLVDSYGMKPERVRFEIDTDSVLLPVEAAIPCGLIVNELITNAFRHAFPNGRSGDVTIGLTRRDDDEVLFSVSDNGVGLPEGIDLENGKTLGLQLVRLLVAQLSGTVSIHRSNPTQLAVRFRATEDGEAGGCRP